MVTINVGGENWRTGLEFSTRKGGFVIVDERQHSASASEVGKAASPGSSQVLMRQRGEGKSWKRA